jgi:hypothetical protein
VHEWPRVFAIIHLSSGSPVMETSHVNNINNACVYIAGGVYNGVKLNTQTLTSKSLSNVALFAGGVMSSAACSCNNNNNTLLLPTCAHLIRYID